MTRPSWPAWAALLGIIVLGCARDQAAEALLNIRDFGAVGDGRFHPVGDWKDAGRRREFEKMPKPARPADEWSEDEAAFILAKRALPPAGGTIYFPSGTYLASADSWRILSDHVRLLGDGADRSILTTGPRVAECLVLSGYRHVGWSRGYPFAADDGGRGTLGLRLMEPGESGKFAEGGLVFIRSGANRFDQDYGEFNEVAHVGEGGIVELAHPLARDYRLASANWAGMLGAPLVMPPVGSAADAVFSKGPGCFIPAPGDTVSVAGQSFRVESAGRDSPVKLVNLGHGNLPAGVRLESGSLVARERGLIVLSGSTRDFRCEGLTIRGRRKALDLSNSYGSSFVDCTIERRPAEARVSGGIVIDGDDGRFATFSRCTVRADPPCGMQFARSFGDVSFNDCHFINADAAFTEFCFNCSVTDSSFDVSGRPRFRDVIIMGGSCGNIRLVGNTIQARAVDAVFDSRTDIQSYKHRSEGDFVVSDNRVVAEDTGAIFLLDSRAPVTLRGNQVSGHFRTMGDGSANAGP
jgi:hypothetical protein